MQLGDVVPVAAGQRGGQRDAAGIGDHVVLRARPGPVNRAGTGLAPPFSARTCDPSAAARDQSITPAACSRASSTSCSRCHTPAGVPVPQPPPAGHPRAVAQLLRQELPRDAGVQHEQDPAQRLAVIQPPPSRMPEPALGLRQQRLDQLPQAVLDLPRPALRHASLLPDAHPSSKKQTTSDVIC